MIDPLSNAIVGHLVGDYILQNNYLAMNKKKNSWVCFLHCYLYTLSVNICTFNVWPLWCYILIFLEHFVQDRTYVIDWLMDYVLGQREFRQNLTPWSSIVVDNVFHILFLWVIANFVGQ